MRAYHFAHREALLAKMRERYRANRERHNANSAAYYAAHKEQTLAGQHRYRKTAAGMLTGTRHNANRRGT